MSTLAQYEQISIVNKLAAAVLIVSITAYYNWQEHVQPKLTTIEQKTEELQKLKDDQKRLASSLIDPVSLDEEINQANREYKKMIELLPTEPAIEKVLNDFAGLTRITGIEMKEFMPSMNRKTADQKDTNKNSPSESTDVSSVFINVNLEGSFSSILSFLDMAMSLPRVLRIQDFEIENTGNILNLSQKPKLKTKIDFVTYFQGSNNRQTSMPEKEPKISESTKATSGKENSRGKSLSAKGQTGAEE